MLKIAICDDDLGFTGSLENLVLEESQSMESGLIRMYFLMERHF